MSTLPPIISIQVSTVPLPAYLQRIAAIQAAAGTQSPLPEVNFNLGTLIVGDGDVGAGPQIPPLSTLENNLAVTHQVWSGQCVQSTSVDPNNAAQCDILCVIPSVTPSGTEIGPFWVTNFVLTDENGAPMIIGTTLAPKFTSANGAPVDLALSIAVAYSAGTVQIQAPTAPWMTQAQIEAALMGAVTGSPPITVTQTVNSGGWPRWLVGVVGATLGALGVGRPATDAEITAGGPAGGGYQFPWVQIEQLLGQIAALKAWVLIQISLLPVVWKLTASDFYVNGATGLDSNNGLTPGAPFKTLQGAFAYLSQYQAPFVNVHVAAGTYEALLVSQSGIAAWNFIFATGCGVQPSSAAVNSGHAIAVNLKTAVGSA